MTTITLKEPFSTVITEQAAKRGLTPTALLKVMVAEKFGRELGECSDAVAALHPYTKEEERENARYGNVWCPERQMFIMAQTDDEYARLSTAIKHYRLFED